MKSYWKPTAAQMKAIRAYAAKSAGKGPRQIAMKLNTRTALEAGTPQQYSENLLLVGGGWGEKEMLEHSDLHDHDSFTTQDTIDLDERGRAIIDISVYSLYGFGAERDIDQLETHVQVWVAPTPDMKKATIVRLTGTGTKTEYL